MEKYDSNGELLSTTSLTSDEKLTIANNPERFEINGLEKLNAGQYYILKYKYKVDKDKCTDKKLSGYFGNGANAKYDGGDWTDPYWWSTTYKNRLQKSGTYDKITNKIKWEVLVRNLKDGADLEDYTVEDTLGTTGAKIDDPVLIYAGNDESSLNPQESSTVDFKKNSAGENVGFTYTFKRGSIQKYYKFVYYTNAVDGVAQVDNKATISKGNDSESVDVPTKTDKRDQYVGKAAVGSLETAKGNKNLMKAPRWYFTVALPTGSTAKSIEAYDWFIPATNGTQTADHYAFYEELKEQLNKCIRIYTTTTGYDEKDVTWAANNGIQVTYEMYQNYTKTAEGIEPGELATQAGDKVRAFKIKIGFNDSKAGNVWKLNVGVAGYTGYSSYIDTTSVNLKDGKNWTIENSIKALGEEKSAYYTYQKTPGKNSLEKMVSNKENGEGWYFCQPDEAGSFDYAKASTIWYKLWLEVDSKQDTVKIKDTLPKGMILDSTQSPYAFYASEGEKQDSVYNKDNCKYPANDFSVSTSTNVNDQQEIAFTLKNVKENVEQAQENNKNVNRIAIAYCVKVDDSDWNLPITSEKTYVNRAEWDLGAPVEATAIVKRSNTYLTKTSEYAVGQQTVKYSLDINSAAQKLNPRESYLDLEDEFVVSKRAAATLDRASVKLYRVDENDNETEEQITDMTTAIEEKAENSTEKTKYIIRLKVPDGAHYRLEYVYKLDTSKAIAQEITLENKATIGAAWKVAEPVRYVHVSGGASAATAGQIRLLKVAANDEQITLAGVKFDLYAYNRENHAFEQVGNTLTTRADGTILMTPGTDAGYDVQKMQTNTLYKLVEKESINGYVNSGVTYYFIWLANEDTNSNRKTAYKEATGEDNETALVGEMTPTERDGIIYYTHGKSYELKVTNAAKKLEIKKIWKDENGNVLSEAPDGITQIEVAVYKYPSNETFSDVYLTPNNLVENITLSQQNNWKATFTNLADGYNYYVNEVELNNKYDTIYTNRDGEHTQFGYTNGDKVTITNQKRSTSLTVKKYWQAGENSPLPEILPQSVTIQLYKKSTDNQTDEKVGDVVTLTEAGNWSYIFKELDPDAHYYVKEEPVVDGFTVTYDNNDGVNPGGTIKVINTATEAPTYELPSTGSPGGTVPYTAGGAAIALAAVLCGYNSRRKRKRGEE